MPAYLIVIKVKKDKKFASESICTTKGEDAEEDRLHKKGELYVGVTPHD